MAAAIAQNLYVGKRDRFELSGSGFSAWLAGEPLNSVTVRPDVTKATLPEPAVISGESISFFLDGVARGSCKVHIAYATATRSACITAVVQVLAC